MCLLQGQKLSLRFFFVSDSAAYIAYRLIYNLRKSSIEIPFIILHCGIRTEELLRIWALY